MRLVSYRRPDGRTAFGSLSGEEVTELGEGADLRKALGAGDLAGLASGERLPLESVTLLPAVPDPGKILCIGLNYDAHRQETGREAAEHPTVFTRFADTLAAQGAPIVRPRLSQQLDYEGELAVVIGRAGRAIPEASAMDHVAGYACFNDGSVRDWQRHSTQFIPGKNFPATAGFGPCIVTPDEVGDITQAHVVTRLNGEVVQDQPVSDLIWPIPALIAYLSSFTPLSPGDVIATGTPSGVGAQRQPPLWMKAGDTVEVEIGPVGRLINPVVDEA